MNIAVGTLASATALASSSALASAMPAAPDPIFAAIEIDRKLNAEFMRLSNSEDALRESGIEPVPAQGDHRTPEMVAVVDANIESRLSLAKTVPPTPAGLCAYLDYLLNSSVGTFFFDGDDESMGFLESLHHAVHRMRGLRPMEKTPPLAEPAIALSGPDPIFAAIDAHRSAYAAVDDVLQQQNLLEDGIPADKREWWWGAAICIPRPTAKMIQGGWPCRSN